MFLFRSSFIVGAASVLGLMLGFSTVKAAPAPQDFRPFLHVLEASEAISAATASATGTSASDSASALATAIADAIETVSVSMAPAFVDTGTTGAVQENSAMTPNAGFGAALLVGSVFTLIHVL